MKRPCRAVVVGAALVAALFVVRTPSVAQEAAAPQQTQIVAAIDVTPIKQELTALRAELAAIRAAVAGEKGIRGDLAKATEAIQEMSKLIGELAETIGKYTKATQPIIEALKPPLRWEYRVLRSRSDRVANRLGLDGWELVTGSEDWLFFKRPLPDGEAKEAPKE